MAKVIGFEESSYKKFVCYHCCAIIQYAPNETYYPGSTDEGTKIEGLKCPNCGDFVRTNP